MELFIKAQAQHFFAAVGKVALPEIEQDKVEQRLKFERGPRREYPHQLFGDVVWNTTPERWSYCFRHPTLWL